MSLEPLREYLNSFPDKDTHSQKVLKLENKSVVCVDKKDFNWVDKICFAFRKLHIGSFYLPKIDKRLIKIATESDPVVSLTHQVIQCKLRKGDNDQLTNALKHWQIHKALLYDTEFEKITTPLDSQGYSLKDILSLIQLVTTEKEFKNLQEAYTKLKNQYTEVSKENPFIKNYIDIIDMAIKSKKTDTLAPSTGCGIQNGGNSCYLNATMQALHPLCDLLQSDYDPQAVTRAQNVQWAFLSRQQNSSLNDHIQNIQKELVEKGHTDERKNDVEIVRCVLDNCNNDSQKTRALLKDIYDEQMLNALLAEIFNHTTPKLTQEFKHLFDTIQGQLISQTVTTINTLREKLIECGFHGSRYGQEDAHEAMQKLFEILHIKPFTFESGETKSFENMVSLELPSNKQISEIFQKGYKFQKKDAPEILPVQLKRYTYNEKTGVTSKQDQKVPLETTIRIPLDDSTTVEYELVSVLVHQGATTQDGHYYTYRYQDDKWTEYNDSYVGTKALDKIQNNIEKNGYIHIYKKKSI